MKTGEGADYDDSQHEQARPSLSDEDPSRRDRRTSSAQRLGFKRSTGEAGIHHRPPQHLRGRGDAEHFRNRREPSARPRRRLLYRQPPLRTSGTEAAGGCGAVCQIHHRPQDRRADRQDLLSDKSLSGEGAAPGGLDPEPDQGGKRTDLLQRGHGVRGDPRQLSDHLPVRRVDDGEETGAEEKRRSVSSEPLGDDMG